MRINPDALRAIRERSGLSQTALSTISGISQGHISQLESGQRRSRPETVHRLAAALGVPVGALVSERYDPADSDAR